MRSSSIGKIRYSSSRCSHAGYNKEMALILVKLGLSGYAPFALFCAVLNVTASNNDDVQGKQDHCTLVTRKEIPLRFCSCFRYRANVRGCMSYSRSWLR
ncbi:hypothetical protein ARMGADRAFT_126796 [Armillaria gallica]|uniref:Uncharacterized protein n=1 Tax=Armillaria gallica TaxID=47427 RepID=A0A2H3DE56_ARMGA|nr:hypothetical protein ARMGADRAFT_126796 [Armillaria gallica]